jgi:hypothetical protein
MNERQARANGMEFTGSYERNRADLAFTVKDLKKRGYKASIVTVPDSPLSRGTIGTGYAIYAEHQYFVDKDIRMLELKLSHIEGRKVTALEKYKAELLAIDLDDTEMHAALAEMKRRTI